MRFTLPLILTLTTIASAQTLPSTASAPATTSSPTTRPHFTLSKETTRITTPLLPDGRPDYVRALDESLAKGLTPENNAVVLLLQAFGMGDDVLPEPVRAKALERLGVPEVPDGPKFQALWTYLKQNGMDMSLPDPASMNAGKSSEVSKMSEAEKQAVIRPWTAEEYPLIAKWLDANDAPLNLVARAAQRERYYWPMIATTDRVAMGTVFLAGLGWQRNAATALTMRAMQRLGAGQIKECQADLLAIHRLARLDSQGATLVDKLVAVAIEGRAAKGDTALAEHLKSEDAKTYLTELQALPRLHTIAESVDTTERYIMLDSTLTTAKYGKQSVTDIGGEAKVTTEPGDNWALPNIDWDTLLTHMNRYYDRIVLALSKPTFGQRKSEMAALEKEIQQVKAKFTTAPSADPTQHLGEMLISILLPSLGRASELEDRGRQRSDLALVAIALVAYRGEHNAYPEKLADLSPAYLKEIPPDLFADAPLIYRKQDKGYLLYSIGPDLKDDQGVPGKTDATGDMVIQMTK